VAFQQFVRDSPAVAPNAYHGTSSGDGDMLEIFRQDKTVISGFLLPAAFPLVFAGHVVFGIDDLGRNSRKVLRSSFDR
jgi:hypothetical protein